MPIYMKYDGIDGDVTAKGHEKWIELQSAQYGVGRGISSPVGGSADREASSPSISELVVTKTGDATSPKFFQESVVGEAKAVVIDFVRTSANKLETYLKIELTNTLVSGYSVSSGGDNPSESISLNFTKIQVTYTSFNADHTKGTPITAGYDLSEATKS